VVGAITIAVGGCGPASGRLPLRLVARVPLPGPSARFDYQDVDPVAHRLFIAHLGASHVDVIDLNSLKVVAVVAGLSQVHGVRVVPGIGRLYASVTGQNEIATLDEATLTVVSRAPAGGYPDGIAYAPSVDKVYVSNELGGSETVVDARSGQFDGTIALGGQAGNVAFDPSSGRVFVAVQTQNALVAIDPASDRIVARTRLTGCVHSHGLYIDESSSAFVTCDGNGRLLLVNLKSMRVVAAAGTGPKPDVLAFDPGLRRLYVAAESGTLGVYDVTGERLRRLGLARLAGSAHTVAVDPESHRVFFPLHGRTHPFLQVMRGVT